MNNLKHILLFWFMLLATLIPAHAQNETSTSSTSATLSADIVSRYVWRGQQLSEAAAIQPTLDFTFGSFSIGSWASYTFSAEGLQEVDLYLSYAAGNFTFTVNDYFNPVDTMGFQHDYFNWDSKTTLHSLEAAVTYGGTDNFPLELTAGIYFFGNDKDDNGDNNYSTYFEAAYSKQINETLCKGFIGFTPSEGYYADEFSVVNLGVSITKEIQLSDTFSIPCTGTFSLNPHMENVYFVLAFSL